MESARDTLQHRAGIIGFSSTSVALTVRGPLDLCRCEGQSVAVNLVSRSRLSPCGNVASFALFPCRSRLPDWRNWGRFRRAFHSVICSAPVFYADPAKRE